MAELRCSTSARAGERQAAVGEPAFGLGGVVPGAFGDGAGELGHELVRRTEFAELPFAGVQAKLHLRIEAVDRPVTAEPFDQFDTPLVPVARNWFGSKRLAPSHPTCGCS